MGIGEEEADVGGDRLGSLNRSLKAKWRDCEFIILSVQHPMWYYFGVLTNSH